MHIYLIERFGFGKYIYLYLLFFRSLSLSPQHEGQVRSVDAAPRGTREESIYIYRERDICVGYLQPSTVKGTVDGWLKHPTVNSWFFA